MKIAISLPDNLFAVVDKFANDHDLSRSALVAEALREYMGKHRDDDLTAKMRMSSVNQTQSFGAHHGKNPTRRYLAGRAR
jgi:metal-responsive CopG/Arc/MetJ family transcriptional regulator